MGKPIASDELWAEIEPLLPASKPRRWKYPGRRSVSDRAALTCIVFVLRTGIRWRDLPAEMGCGSGVTCWRRLRDWQEAGVWEKLHELLLAKLRAADQIDFSRVVVDSSSIRAVGAGEKQARTPPIVRDQVPSTTSPRTPMASPVAAILTGANCNDVTQLLPLVDAIAPIRGVRGRPLQKPEAIYADRGNDSERHRQELRGRGIKPVLARRGTEHGSGLGKYRWVVERTHAWLHHFRRLRIRFERRGDIHEAFLKRGCCLICWNTLQRAEPSLARSRYLVSLVHRVVDVRGCLGTDCHPRR